MCIETFRNEVNDARNNVEQSQRKLSSLREGQKDRLKRFGSKVPELLRRVETAVRRGRFHKPPKGPVGMMFYTARKATDLLQVVDFNCLLQVVKLIILRV